MRTPDTTHWAFGRSPARERRASARVENIKEPVLDCCHFSYGRRGRLPARLLQTRGHPSMNAVDEGVCQHDYGIIEIYDIYVFIVVNILHFSPKVKFHCSAQERSGIA